MAEFNSSTPGEKKVTVIETIDWRKVSYDELFFTDYPFVELGDTPGQQAPIREARFRSFDGNKYATVECGGQIVELKAGYLLRTREELELQRR